MTKGWVCSPHPGDGKVEKLSLSLEDIWVLLQEFLALDQARISLGDKSIQCGDSKRSYHFLAEARRPSNVRSKWGHLTSKMSTCEPICWTIRASFLGSTLTGHITEPVSDQVSSRNPHPTLHASVPQMTINRCAHLTGLLWGFMS